MNLNQPSLVLFEEVRKSNNVIPPAGSNSFYDIGDARINLLTKRSDRDNYRFELFTDSGELIIGNKPFNIAGDIDNIEYPYENFTVIKNTGIKISSMFGIYRGMFESHGKVHIESHGYITIRNGGSATLYRDSDLIIDDGAGLQIDDGCALYIYGDIYIHLSMVDVLLGKKNIIIDPGSVMYVNNLDSLGTRLFSLTDYFTELSNRVINMNTQGEKNFIRGIGRIGYIWKHGNPLKRYQILTMHVLYGNAILGDFKFSVLGLPTDDLTDVQIIDSFIIDKGCTLHITDDYDGYKYIHPQLYLGILIGNCKTPGKCIVNGKIIVTGHNSSITIDRGASLVIEEDGEVIVSNGSTVLCTNNGTDEVLIINGTLTIDTIEQISTFNSENIVFGESGKLVIKNPDTGDNKILFSTPNGIYDTELYRLFRGRLDNVEYHISKNNGIEIDQFYEFFHKDFVSWYNGIRIEKAIYKKLIVWENGGFIKLSNEVIPWVNNESNLLHASRIFKSFGSTDNEKLQEVVNRLKYVGCGDITFIFDHDGNSHEVTLVLDESNMENSINNPMSNSFVLYTDNSGELFMRNNLPVVSPETIISKESVMIPVESPYTSFRLK